MKRTEKIIVKLVIIHFILLIFAQLLNFTSLSPYLTRMIDYEGVTTNNYTKTLNTIAE